MPEIEGCGLFDRGTVKERQGNMKKLSRAGGKVPKARHSKSFKLKRHIVPKPTAAPSSAMQQIADWLEKLGMSEYAQRFAENEIDVSVLRRSHRSGP